jgi:antitoxin HigA-1
LEDSTKVATAKKLSPIFPGEILHEDFLIPAGISINRLAMDIHVPVSRVYEIVKGERAITADTALRLARYLGTSAEFWMNLQTKYELRKTMEERAKTIEAEVRPLAAAGR